MKTLASLLASLIVATLLVIYVSAITLIAHLVPVWLSPIVIIITLTFLIHITTYKR